MLGTRAISTTSRRKMSSIFSPERQGAEGNSRNSDKNISFFLPGRTKDLSAPLYLFTYLFIHPYSSTALVDQETLMVEASKLYSSQRPVPDNTHAPQRNSNPPSQQASSRRPKPCNARPNIHSEQKRF